MANVYAALLVKNSARGIQSNFSFRIKKKQYKLTNSNLKKLKNR